MSRLWLVVVTVLVLLVLVVVLVEMAVVAMFCYATCIFFLSFILSVFPFMSSVVFCFVLFML